MEIRKACTDDLEALFLNRLEFVKEMSGNESSLPEGYEEAVYQYMRERLINDSMVAWIAVEEGKIVASAIVCFYQLIPMLSNPTGYTGSIHNVSTHPNYRRRGLAKQLVNHIIEEARERKVGKLYLSATDMGKPLYEKLGFEVLTKDMVYKIV